MESDKIIISLQIKRTELELLKRVSSQKSLSVSSFLRNSAIEKARDFLNPSIEDLFQKALKNSLKIEDLEKRDLNQKKEASV